MDIDIRDPYAIQGVLKVLWSAVMGDEPLNFIPIGVPLPHEQVDADMDRVVTLMSKD